jgi:predicted TIM-barrel fold metal-dependent hydrolase
MTDRLGSGPTVVGVATTTLSQAQRADILGGNAARLLNIKDI